MDFGFLRTRVGRRYLTVHLLTAIVPLAAIAGLSFALVKRELRSQAEARTIRLSKSLSIATLSALTTAAADLRREALAPEDSTTKGLLVGTTLRSLGEGVPSALVGGTGVRSLTSDEQSHLQSGRPLLVPVTADGTPRIFLASAIGPWKQEITRLVWARINPSQVWGAIGDALGGEGASFCIFDNSAQRLLHCSPELTEDAIAAAQLYAERPASERIVEEAGAHFLASRDTYLRHEFGAPEWQAIVLLPVNLSFAALQSFRRMFVLLMAAVAVFIFMLSHAQIRRTTEPLARLQEGTRRLQRGDFSEAVQVISDDEYGELALSFNGMAQTLDRQMVQMRDLDAIDQVAMTERKAQAVVEEALQRAWAAAARTRVTIGLMSATSPDTMDLWCMDPSGRRERGRSATLTNAERDELLAHQRDFFIKLPTEDRSYLARSMSDTGCGIEVFPLIDDDRLLGILVATTSRTESRDEEHTLTMRRLADRMAMALANVGLVRRLDELSAGTMVAFARAIDANSRWTAGHSERVTQVALAIGAQLQLKASDLATLERGALLHDIGKIAVPATVLDKNGPLNDDEWRIMRSHPVVGFDILSPIPAFTDALPLVRWHHERLDGSGYPDRLAGDDIPFLARVLSVADVFDALVSDRPYRPGLTTGAASDLMKTEFRNHLDPRVMLAFLDGIRLGKITANLSYSASRASDPSADQRSLLLSSV